MQQWMSLLAALHPISLSERVFKIWHFTGNLRIAFGRKDTMWTVRGLYHAVWNFSKDIYVSKEGYEILQQQWVSLLVTLHPITSCWEGVQNLAFCTIIETCFWQKWHSLDPKYCGLCYTKLVEPFLWILEGFETLRKHSLSLLVTPVSPFLCWEGAQNLPLSMKFESCSCQKYHFVDHKRRILCCMKLL